jgi:hypothetical protein
MRTSRRRRNPSSAYRRATWFLAPILLAALPARAGDGWAHAPYAPHLFESFHPAGGWHPDGGGLLHWWNPCCFPRCGGPDDYCRKPPPRVCWPPYPPYYIIGGPPVGGSACGVGH